MWPVLRRILGGWVVLAAGLLVAAWSGCGSSGESPGSPSAGPPTVASAPPAGALLRAEIRVEQFAYAPRSLTVAPGTTVVWINLDDAPHTVTEETRRFESEALDTDDMYERRFEEPGTYRYFCALHPHMTGEVVVRTQTDSP